MTADPFSLQTLALIAVAFLFAGTVKGVVGAGLPTFSLPILALGLGLKDGIALIVIPAIVTNIWQGLVGGQLLAITRRLGTFLIATVIGTWAGAVILAGADALLLSGVLGIFLFLYSIFSLATPQIPAPGRAEKYLSPVMGGATGVMLGMIGSFFVPGVLYLQALGMNRDQLVQALGIAFTLGSLALGIGLAGNGLFTVSHAGLSALGIVPALIGMAAGQRLRRRLSEHRFRQALFGALLIIAVFLALRAFVF
jgi:uncharacterized membrane protein YfcA